MSRLRTRLAPALAACCIALAGPAGAQCLLANPSFELPGSPGSSFGGWNQFGSVGTSSNAVHGAAAARVSGPNTGGWDVSGLWQALETTPGMRWSASVHVTNTSAQPLTGQSQAIVNIEWRDGGGNLIGYESHTAADASTPVDAVEVFSVTSAPAPAGTVTARLLLGVLQGPADPTPQVHYDLATFDALGPPTLDQRQWNEFPGGRTLAFSGRTWRVKGPGYFGPGPNLFSDAADAVWVDANDRLHLTLRNVSGSWYSSEVALEQPLGYGDYVFTTRGRLDLLDPRAVLGLFIWQYGACWDPGYLWWNPFNEIDIEFSRWGSPANGIGQFVAQPYDYPGNIRRFAATFAVNEVTSHAFRWLPDRVEYRSWRGGPGDEATSAPIHAWTYDGPHVPRPEQPRVHLNLWRFEGSPAANQEVVIEAFTFVPACPSLPCRVLAAEPPADGPARLGSPSPNPFASSTTIRFAAPRSGPAEIAVYDVSGRRVRTLVREALAAGEHVARWNGRDDAGRRLPAGVYLCQLRMDDLRETKRVVLLP